MAAIDDNERPDNFSGHPRGRRRMLGCVFLLLAVLVVVAVLVWIDSEQTREPPNNDFAPVPAEVPPEAVPPPPPA